MRSVIFFILLLQLHHFPVPLLNSLLFLHHQLIQSRQNLRNLVPIPRHYIQKRVAVLHQISMDQFYRSTQHRVVHLVEISQVIIV